MDQFNVRADLEKIKCSSVIIENPLLGDDFPTGNKVRCL